MLKRPFQHQGDDTLGQMALNKLQVGDSENPGFTRILGVKVGQAMFFIIDRDDYPEESADFWHSQDFISDFRLMPSAPNARVQRARATALAEPSWARYI